MKKPAVTMADLGMTPGEAQLFDNGARHLFGAPPEENEEPAAAPAPKAKAVPAGALTDIPLSGGKKAGAKPVAKKSQGKSH